MQDQKFLEIKIIGSWNFWDQDHEITTFLILDHEDTIFYDHMIIEYVLNQITQSWKITLHGSKDQFPFRLKVSSVKVPLAPPLEKAVFCYIRTSATEKFLFREKKGCTPNYFFQKLGGNP